MENNTNTTEKPFCSKDLSSKGFPEGELIFREIVMKCSDGILVIDKEGEILLANQAAGDIFGSTPDLLIGKSFGFPVSAGEKTEIDIIRPDGIAVVADMHVEQIAWGDRFVALASIRDITDRKQYENLVAQERKRLFSILENIPAYVYLQSKDYSVPYANCLFRKNFGDITGKKCYTLLWKRDEPCIECSPFKVFESGEQQCWEWNKAPDGRTYQVFDCPYTDADGSQHVLELGIDISERKLAEEEKKRLIIELQESLAKIKTLRGLLPICSSCKKIRNDEGYWEQVEVYISDHSEAEFSHGICDECGMRLYPNQWKKIVEERGK